MTIKKSIQSVNLKTQYETIQNEINSAIQKVLNHSQFILGPEVQELEEKLATFVGVKHCIGVANGTDALLMALMALNIQQGDEVITSPFSFFASAEVIALLGAKPVFVDINPDTFTINSNLIEKAITSKTKAILAISLFGQCADFDEINALAQNYSLPVIEDGAQSFGATYKNRQSCGLSTIGCTSFFPTKPLGCYGDGGACFTNDSNLADILKKIRVHGQKLRSQHQIMGINGRLDTIQAAILLEKLKIFPQELEKRKEIAALYSELLPSTIKIPFIEHFNTSNYAQYTIRVRQRDSLRSFLKNHEIPTEIYYSTPIHLQPAFAYLKNSIMSYPHAEQIANEVLSLPIHPYLNIMDIKHICTTIKKWVDTLIFDKNKTKSALELVES